MSTFLNREEYIKVSHEVLAFTTIPSQPKAVSDIYQEINNPLSNMETVASHISRDVTMSAKLLKTVNSAFFGLREKVDSINRALSLIGMTNFKNIILSSSLREVLGSNSPSFEKFWNHSMATAAFAAQIAQKTGYPLPEQAYLAGLFHDCGVPILLKRYPDYAQVMDQALNVVPVAALSGGTKSIIGIEHERFRTHHCAIGYLVAQAWKMSPAVCDAIWYHHYVKIDIIKESSAKKLSAVLLLADYMASSVFSDKEGLVVDPEPEWAKMHKSVMYELALNLDKVKEMKEYLAGRVKV